MRLSFDEDGRAMVYDGEPQGAGDIDVVGLLLHHGAQCDLRDALGIKPDTAAKARATLEQARKDDVIPYYSVHSPALERGWIVEIGVCSQTGKRYCDRLGPTDDVSALDGWPAEAEALAAAAAHVETLRKPVLPEPESMTPASGRCLMDATQIEELRRLAEAAQKSLDAGLRSARDAFDCDCSRCQFESAANPQAILSLLAEVEAGRKDRERLDALDNDEIPLHVKLAAWETSDGTSRSAADAIIAAQQQ